MSNVKKTQGKRYTFMGTKSVFIAALLVFCSFSSGAQVIFHGGIFLGVSTSQVSGDQLSGFHKAGLYGGAFVNFHLTDKWLIQIETDYIQKGSRKNPKPEHGDYTSYRLNLQYFEFPVIIKWQFTERFGFEAGPALAYLLKNTNVEKDESGIMPNRPAFNNFDLSMMGGFTVNIISHLKVNVRASQSILPIRKHFSGQTYRLNRGQYNSVLAFTLVGEF